MFRSKILVPAVAGMAMILALGTPAHAAGKAERARTAIAHAEGRIQAGDAAGVAAVLPDRQAEARKALNTAKEDLAAGRKEEAISEANRATAIAEAALGQSQQIKAEQANAQAQQAQDVQARAQQAEVNATVAQQQAADATARAANAEQAAAASAVRADVAVATANAAAANQVETTVTTETKAAPVAKARASRKVVKVQRKAVARKVPAAVTETTTVTTRTQP